MQLDDIAKKIRAFRDERDWKQFHNPKDMAIALSIEVSELLEHFLWKNPEQVASRIEAKRDEIESEFHADILSNHIEEKVLGSLGDSGQVGGSQRTRLLAQFAPPHGLDPERYRYPSRH